MTFQFLIYNDRLKQFTVLKCDINEVKAKTLVVQSNASIARVVVLIFDYARAYRVWISKVCLNLCARVTESVTKSNERIDSFLIEGWTGLV